MRPAARATHHPARRVPRPQRRGAPGAPPGGRRGHAPAALAPTLAAHRAPVSGLIPRPRRAHTPRRRYPPMSRRPAVRTVRTVRTLQIPRSHGAGPGAGAYTGTSPSALNSRHMTAGCHDPAIPTASPTSPGDRHPPAPSPPPGARAGYPGGKLSAADPAPRAERPPPSHPPPARHSVFASGSGRSSRRLAKSRWADGSSATSRFGSPGAGRFGTVA